jgi:hypothetical protein
VQAHEQGYPAEDPLLEGSELAVWALVVPLRASGVLFDGLGMLCDRWDDLHGAAPIANDSLNEESDVSLSLQWFRTDMGTTNDLLVLV